MIKRENKSDARMIAQIRSRKIWPASKSKFLSLSLSFFFFPPSLSFSLYPWPLCFSPATPSPYFPCFLRQAITLSLSHSLSDERGRPLWLSFVLSPTIHPYPLPGCPVRARTSHASWPCLTPLPSSSPPITPLPDRWMTPWHQPPL
jgi:hypothetical protein